MTSPSDIISARRESVIQAYNSARAENHLRFLEGDDKATAEYIFPNQMEDANNIVDMFYTKGRRVISIQKKTKVGADGLMIEIAKLLTTHIDDGFVVNPANVRIITGMSNAGWEKDMIDKAPNCFKDKIFHHGKLERAGIKLITKDELTGVTNGLFIIDEIDSGDKPEQKLQTILKEAGVLDVKHMEEHNNRFVFISATMIKELYDLYRWGELHELYKMTIPSSYIGHKDFLEKGIVKEFYAVNTQEAADKWVQEDILDCYNKTCMCTKCNPEKNPDKKDFRVHLVRVTAKNVNVVQNACIRKGVIFRNHTSSDRLSHGEIKELFKEPLTNHIVLGVKGFFRRANLIPNRWKLRIGATLELYTKIVDNNVQIQALTGRMTGYWREDIEGGHKTGPHRTSIKAIEEYEKTYEDPFGTNSYQTAGFKKTKGKVSASPTMLSPKNIQHLKPIDLPAVQEEKIDSKLYRIYSDEDMVRSVCKLLGYHYVSTKDNTDGFKETSLNNKTSVVSIRDAVKKVPTAYGTNNGIRTYRTYYPCYLDTTDKTSLRFVVIIRPGTDETKVVDCDSKFPSLSL
uniref:Uncharacterized protein n=1 Tax=viral metagenome TaxID=1070528 RepID=A0A6C0DBA7_9ZZZZ